MTNLVKINPKEYGLEESSVKEIESAFAVKLAEKEPLISMYKSLITKELNPQLCKEAKDLRNKLVKVRTGIAEIHKSQKAYFLAAGRFVDAWKNKETEPIEQMESKLKEIETYFEKIEAERIAKLKAERIEKLSTVCETPEMYPLEQMSDEAFDNLLNGLKVAKEQKEAEEKRIELERIEAEKKAEADRLAKIEADRIERERIEKENARLKAEAEAKEKALKLEREKAESERKAIEEKARKEREAIETAARIEREKQAKIQAKKDAELKKIQEKALRLEREKQAEIERLEVIELQKKKDAEKLAKSSDKNKLNVWVDSFVISQECNVSDKSIETKKEIIEKFNSFKNWAKKQVENI